MAAGEKQLLRNQIRRSLAELPSSTREDASISIRESLEESEIFQSAKVIYAFAPTSKEPDWLLNSLPSGMTFAFPRIRDNRVDFYVVDELERMTPGAFGILEPPLDEPAPGPDLIFVPGVAFDMHGNRIGRGGGYYDRVLSRFAGYRLGIAFDFQVLLSVPTDPHDKPVQAILTENGFRICHGGRDHHLPKAESREVSPKETDPR